MKSDISNVAKDVVKKTWKEIHEGSYNMGYTD
jgi:hypothetical protein